MLVLPSSLNQVTSKHTGGDAQLAKSSETSLALVKVSSVLIHVYEILNHEADVKNQDLWAYFHAGGDPQKLVEDNAKIARAEVDAMLVATHRSTSKFYEVKESPGKGLGAFATRSFQRGDLVFAEWPLYTIPRDKPDEGLFEVMIRIPPSAMREFLSLHDTGTLQPPPDDPLCQEALAATMIKIKSIQNGNILGVGNNKLALGLRFSRFNYSCAPNAAYSWHDEMGTIRVYALRTIEKGEEITCSANMRDALYGRAKKERNEHLKAHNFTCLCSACTLPRAEQVGSDRRRKELRRLFDTMIVHPAPVSEAWQSRIKLYEVVSALRFMEEEGLAGDTGDFTLVAARHCVFHSDWDSVKYWAAMTYESRASQYGADSPRALGLLEPDVINLLLSPRTNRLVGMGEVHLLTDIRL